MLLRMNPFYVARIQRSTFIRNVRQIHGTRSLKSEITKGANKENAADPSVSQRGLHDLRVNKFDRLLLVLGGKYKKVNDVPNFVNQSVLEKARSKGRIKISIWTIIVSSVLCVIMIISGKRASERGESITKLNEEFRKEVVAKAEKEDKK